MGLFLLVALSAVVLLTSALTGVLGFGGGLVLIAVLPWFLPLHSIIPLHGVTQLVSNVTRAFGERQHLAWGYVWPFALGSALGVLLLGSVAAQIPSRWLPLFIGSFLLTTLWLPASTVGLNRLNNMLVIGAVQSGFGLVIGTTGPLTMGLLHRDHLSKDAQVGTNALLMTLSHGFKVVFFVWLAFPFWEYWYLLLLMVVASMLGTWFGKLLRGKVSEQGFRRVSKVLLTLIGLQLLVQPWL